MPPRESPSRLHDESREALAADGARLAAEGKAISDEMNALLSDAFAAVLANESELAALDPASARDMVDFLVRCGRMTREDGDAVVQRATGRATAEEQPL